MAVIGTAGHVDHGKSALVEALTGVNPDRLGEERERGMTIDLGYGWFTLSDGDTVGVVDVPGHSNYLENMLAGMNGLDLILLVIAADEGVMPQTREHVQIIDLLGIAPGIVVLTKADLVSDETCWQALEDEVSELLAGTTLQKAPRVRFSASTGQGKGQVLDTIAEVFQHRPKSNNVGRPRLAVDRVFHQPGYGPIVTGTLQGGSLAVGEEVQLLPGGKIARIRGIQSYRQPVDCTPPGSRVALNLAGIAIDQIRRGDVVAKVGMLSPSTRIHCSIRLLAGIAHPLKHMDQVKVFAGAAETMARVRLLEGEGLTGGDEGLVEMEFERPLVLERGERFILRRPSPAETIGGGEVIRPGVAERARRNDARLLAELAAFASGRLEERLAAWMAGRIFGDPSGWIDLPVERMDLLPLLDQLMLDGRVIRLAGDILLTRTDLEDWERKILAAVSRYHERYPLRNGLRIEELRLSLKLIQAEMTAFISRLEKHQRLVEDEAVLHLPDFRIQYSRSQQAAVDALLNRFTEAPYHPPLVGEATAAVGEEIFRSLLAGGILVRLSEEVVLRKEDWNLARQAILDRLDGEGQISLAQVRDQFSTSRRYAQAMLEMLDRTGETERVGEFHRRKE